MSKKIKYRIKTHSSTTCPFVLERKIGFFSWWLCVGMYSTAAEAEGNIAQIHAKYVKAAVPPPGTIVKVYEPIDLTALMLKGSNENE